MSGNFTFFTNEGAAGQNAVSYIQDVFPDVTLPATSNSGLTDNASTNPLGMYFKDTDTVQYGVKTLFIKDIILVQDRSKWINGKTTYRIVWNENFAAVGGYVFGNVDLNYKTDQPYVKVDSIGDGVGVGGVIRKVQWIVDDDTAATATAQLMLDGANTTTVSFPSLNPDSFDQNQPRASAFVAEATNETKDLHDFRITAIQNGTLKVIGVVVYFENAGRDLDCFPGTTYIDKSKVTTGSVATLPIPSFGSSLGGAVLVYKNDASSYAVASQSFTTMVSVAVGSSGTNILNVSTGTGASFPIGSGVAVSQGTSNFVGIVQNVSTDALTVLPTLPFGISNSVYRTWLSGSTYAINASLMTLSSSFDFSKLTGLSRSLLDPQGRMNFWQAGLGLTYVSTYVSSSLINGVQCLVFPAGTGYFQLDGDFSAAEMEVVGGGILNAQVGVNGLASYTINQGSTGTTKHTFFTEAGSGWNSIVFTAGSSMNASGALGIARLNMYQRSMPGGVTFGQLSKFFTNQTYTNRGAINCTTMSLGTYRRVYADHLYLPGSWVRQTGTTLAGGVAYIGSSTNSAIQFQYYGKDFGLVGTAPAGGTLTLDGAGVPLTFNVMQTGATEMFHTVALSVASGTCVIQAIDYSRSQSEVKALNNYYGAMKARDIKYAALYRIQAANSGVSYPNGNVFFPLPFDQKIYGNKDLITIGQTTWKFVPDRNGYYTFQAQISANPGATIAALSRFQCNVFLNYQNNFQTVFGVLDTQSILSAANLVTMNPAMTMYLAAGDVFQLHIRANAGTACPINQSNTYLSINYEDTGES